MPRQRTWILFADSMVDNEEPLIEFINGIDPKRTFPRESQYGNNDDGGYGSVTSI